MSEALTIPRVPGATTQATYLVGTPEQVLEIAASVGAVERDTYGAHVLPSIVEYHYDADEDEPERWILVCRWSVGEVACTVQSAPTFEPTGAGTPA